jgi:hypothetical protein
MTRSCAVVALSVLMVAGLAHVGPVSAQTGKVSTGADKAAAGAANAPATSIKVSTNNGATMLVRMLLVALHQAALTGNYTVLRDIGSPQFRNANTPMSLADATKDLRSNRFRFDRASLATPVLLQPPQRDEQGRLRLYGFVPTNPEQVLFDLRYSDVNGEWMIDGMRMQIGKVGPKLAEAVGEAKAKQMAKTDAGKNSVQSSTNLPAPAASSSNAAGTPGGTATAVEASDDALAAFGQQLQSHGVVSAKTTPEPPTKKAKP